MKKILSIFTALAMLICFFPTVNVSALENAEYIYYTVNADNSLTENTGTAVCSVIGSSTTQLTDGWYYVGGDVTITDRIEISGTVNLILTDGSTLTASGGIHLKEGNTLNIYGQSEGTGKLDAYLYNQATSPDTYSFFAAIGGNYSSTNGENGGTLNVHGGNIIATATYEAAAIGGGKGGSDGGNGGTVTIYGGTVTAYAWKGAGIGGGQGDMWGGNGGKVTVYGGEVKAYASEGAAIGGGQGDMWGGNGGKVTVYGGEVKAYASEGAAIGGGHGDDRGGGNGTDLTVYGGEVTATSDYTMIGDGSCSGSGSPGAAGSTKIYGGTVTAKSYNNPESKAFDHVPTYGNGYIPKVSYGESSSSVTESINPPDSAYASKYVSIENALSKKDYIYCELNGTKPVQKTGTAVCTPIDSSTTQLTDGGWYAVSGNITIADRIEISGTVDLILTDGSTLTAQNGIYLPEGSTLNIYGQSAGTGKLEAYEASGNNRAVIGGDFEYDNNKNGGSLNVHGGEVTAESSSAAIGGGGGLNYGGNGCRLTVYGGKVTANAEDTAIGGGNSSKAGGNGGTVTVYGGEIAAHSTGSAAIGGGYCYDGSENGGSLTVYGGRVTASSDKGAAISRGYRYHTIFTPINVIKLGRGMTAYTSTDVSGSGKTHVTDYTDLGKLFADGNIRFVEISVQLCDHSANTNPACEGANCSVCGEYIAPTGHKDSEPVIENETEALCEKGGTYDEVIYCSVCGKEISRETKTADAKGHIPAAPVIENEKADGTYDEVIYCAVCNKELSRESKLKEAHTHVEGTADVITMPTFTAAGSRVFRCTLCGEVIRTEAIPPITFDIPTGTGSASEVKYTEFPELKYSIEIKDGTAFITWNDIETADRYVVYSIANGKTTEIARTKGTSYETKHRNGTDYLVRYMKNGVLSPKAKSSADTVKSDKPMVTATSGKDFVRLSWQDMGAEKYNIYKYADGKAVKIGTVTGMSVRIKNLIPDTEYKFIVTAVVDGKETSMTTSDIVTVRTEKI